MKWYIWALIAIAIILIITYVVKSKSKTSVDTQSEVKKAFDAFQITKITD